MYRVKIEGWPAGINFLPLTQACSGVGDTERLLKSWESGGTNWHKLTEEEYAIEKQKRDAHAKDSEIEVQRPCKTHSNKGRKRMKHGGSTKKALSREFVDTTDDEDNESKDHTYEDAQLELAAQKKRAKRPRREASVSSTGSCNDGDGGGDGSGGSHGMPRPSSIPSVPSLVQGSPWSATGSSTNGALSLLTTPEFGPTPHDFGLDL